MERLGIGTLSKAQFFMLSKHKPPEVVGLLRKIRRERASLLTGFECHVIYSLAKAQCHLPGDMAEVGVFQGVSAKLICTVKEGKPLHLFDTFEGLPKAVAIDGDIHRVNQYAWSIEAVQEYLRDCDNVHFYKGLFPKSAEGIVERKYCFVHVDVDLYEGTLECLKYFYSRMVPGGVIISHDYSILEGVKAAFEEFLADKPERAFELPTSQCMITKLPD